MKSPLRLVLVLVVLMGCQKELEPFVEEVDDLKDQSLAPFYHHVASGDPLQDAVIIWTRVTPTNKEEEIDVSWKVSESADMTSIIKEGTFVTDSLRDYTVKVDVTGLESGKKYYYQFEALDVKSPIGETKTASLDAKELSIAVVSCSNYEFGFFNSYRAIADRQDLSAVLHLGDYIYEYAPGDYGDTTTNRINRPAKEIITLQDYRTRYSQYRLDKDLQAVHAKSPFINIWDDHEVANNSYKDGAQNHQDDEGDYEVRKNAAVQAFNEWLPIREVNPLYRKFSFGALAEIFMLDERLAGRTAPVDSLTHPDLNSPDRTMLGAEQLKWLKEGLLSSEAQWKIIGNQVIYSYLNWGYEPNFTLNLDSWDGYPAEQRDIAEFLQKNSVRDVVFVTGDTHTSWAFEVTVDPFQTYNAETSGGAFAVEFGVTSINSGNANEGTPDSLVRLHEEYLVDGTINPHLKYTNMRDHGFLVLTVNKEKAVAEFNIVSTLKSQSFETSVDKVFSVSSGQVKLSE